MKIVTSNLWSRPKIIDSGKFGSKTEICSNFYDICQSQKIEHAYYDHSKCLERSRDYRLTMVVGSEHGTIIRTIIVLIIIPCSEWL